ncbi:phosphatidylinositol-4-phosphate 5-kinase [Trichoderma citrinoviride]|uniref:1-phosphatidylinositol-4-phosphate 5-kinase n=1 Tax=Trichoderma citrinoviride TaxID=58853 RepID=A0A2T4BI97_9HYPO|nr:phosphatidylinositol-4-phosphate 5-kinase [Trichoderma citrinoviride]PTB69042.1 phosphatidylinositol-4-phosphate 5-kinase [Trichoderma citrinoviride]
MPSFLTQDNPTLFPSGNGSVINFDHFSAKDQANEASITDARSYAVHERYDESSTLSTRASDLSDSPVPFRELDQWHDDASASETRPTSMSSLSNGKSLPGGYGAQDRSAHDGVPTSAAPGRPTPPPADDSHSPPQPWTPSLTPASPMASDLALPQHFNGNANINSSSANPQRFSSPASYQAGGSNSAPSLSAHLQPPGPGMGIKQRHTLEVPKPPSARNSRELDTAQASGRFSPTVASPTGGRAASFSLARRTTRSMQSDAPRDEVVHDEDAQRWAEVYRQKRASKKKRKEEEDDDRVLVGTKVDESHANWVTAYNMLTGIRVSVSRTNAKLDRELTDADFHVKQKSTFDITGNELVPSAKYDFKFKDYAPWVFRHLRQAFRLDPADYLMSLTGKYILSELGSPGKSGSFFYFSRDYKYIIKTIHHAEHKFLRKILKEYYEHVTKNPNTLLSQFYGLHRVKMPYGKKIHFVVMNNLFPPHRDVHRTFDLKGSTIGRDYKEEDLEKNPRATLKDLNWLRRKQNLELGIQKKKLFLEQLQRDVALLKRLHIMDYSLLVGIHDLSRGNEENLRGKTLQVFNPGGEKNNEDDLQASLLRTPSKLENYRKAKELRQMVQKERPVPMGQADDQMPDDVGEDRRGLLFNQDDGGFRATHEDNEPAEEIYYLGVIDCLTHYGMIKKIEHFWKGLSNDKSKISALPPDQYGDRFYHFIQGITMSAEEAKRERARRDQEMQAQAEKSRQSTIPPMPTHQPPLPPVGSESNGRAAKSPEPGIPERTLKTSATVPGARDSQHDTVLPVVEEAGESRDDNTERWVRGTSWHSVPEPGRAPPPTPPQDQPYLKPDSSDSGYGDNSNGTVSRDNSLKVARPVSQGSLNKRLPALPKKENSQQGSIRMVK